jgi:hypothetical protein
VRLVFGGRIADPVADCGHPLDPFEDLHLH